MTADFDLEIVLCGNTSEIRDMLKVIEQYDSGRNKPAYFSGILVNGNDLLGNAGEDITKLAASGSVKVTAKGPWGHYSELNDVDIFRDMAEIAPNSSFKAEISGVQQYSVQNLKCELKDGKLRIRTFYELNEEAGEEWMEYFVTKLPLERFKKLFEISGEDFDEDSYGEVVAEMECLCHDFFADMSFDDFVYTIEDNDGETKLEEDRYNDILQNELFTLGIMCPAEFEEDYEGGETKEYVYNPIKKAYEGNSKPLFGGGQKIDMNGLISAGLQAQGLSSDEDTLANLSVEEAYAALGAALEFDNVQTTSTPDQNVRYMYYCPKCNKLFKTVGEGKKIKCTACHNLLCDMHMSETKYAELEPEEKKRLKKRATENNL